MSNSQLEGLVPVAITASMAGRMILTTRATAETLKAAPSASVARVARPDAGVEIPLAPEAKGIACPCCGKETTSPTFEMVIDRHRLTPLQARILEAIWKGRGYPVATETIYLSMYRDDPDGGPPEREMYLSFKVALHYMRRLLKGSGIGVETVGYRRGYRLVVADRTLAEQPDPNLSSWSLRTGSKWVEHDGKSVDHGARSERIEQILADRLERSDERRRQLTAKDSSKPKAEKGAQGGKVAARHLKFVAEFLKDVNAQAAAIRAGYSPGYGHTLLWRPEIRERADVAAALVDAGHRSRRHPSAKLSDEQVMAIRAEFKASKPSMSELAKGYGVSTLTIDNIVKGRQYKSVTAYGDDA